MATELGSQVLWSELIVTPASRSLVRTAPLSALVGTELGSNLVGWPPSSVVGTELGGQVPGLGRNLAPELCHGHETRLSSSVAGTDRSVGVLEFGQNCASECQSGQNLGRIWWGGPQVP